MSYYRLLQQQKKAQEKYEKEALLLKEQVLEINNLYTLYDGDYLDKLKTFNEVYKKQQEKDD